MDNQMRVLTELFSHFNRELDGVPADIVALGGAVAIAVKDDGMADISLIFKEEAVDDSLDDFKEVISDGGRVVFYICPDAPLKEGARSMPLTIISTGNEESLKRAVEKVKAHLRKTGGVEVGGGD